MPRKQISGNKQTLKLLSPDTKKEPSMAKQMAVRQKNGARASARKRDTLLLDRVGDHSEGQFSIARGGHFVDDDGWVVPKNFDEFYERYPKYMLNWVQKRLNRFEVDEDVEGYTQDLLIHLKFSPARFFNRGEGDKACRDLIEAFDRYKEGGASEPNFRKYLNIVLAQILNVIRAKRPVRDVATEEN